MNGDLSHGLPALRTWGRAILRGDTEEEIVPRGVNRSGLEYSEPSPGGFLSSAGMTREEIWEMAVNWGCRIIRLPFNQDWALHGRAGHSADSYLSAIDQVIDWAAEFGAYTLLDLQWLDADTIFGWLGDGTPNHVAPLPNVESIRLWEILAARYRTESAVLFDLFNEPHTPLETDGEPMTIIGENGGFEYTREDVTAETWSCWASRLTDTIRAVHQAALILVSGVNWGADLAGVRIDRPNIIYSAHIYPFHPASTWDQAFGDMASSFPVFVGEWGGAEGDLPWGRAFAEYLRSRRIGWTAWSWSDRPRLLEPHQPGFQPTAFGRLVRDELLL